MLAVGIDLGTTNSLIAVYHGTDDIEIVKTVAGNSMTPSVIGLSDNKEMLIGNAAKSRLISKPDQTIAKFKRAMGTSKLYPLGKKKLSATDLSALVLRQLKQDLQAQFKEGINKVVISVPAYFNSVQRRETLMAGELAGFDVTRLINEPTAAALAYGLNEKDGESLFIVLDLGGGTFDVSILEMFEGVMEVRASSGDAFLGGEDFTQAVAEHFCEKLDMKWKMLSREMQAILYEASEHLKTSVSASETASTDVPFNGEMHELTLSQTEFDQICRPLLLRLRRPIEKCLYDAKLAVHEIERVVLVGGATRMPVVRALAARMFQKLPERSIDPDLVIVQGAAIQAALSAKDQSLDDVVMTDVSPFSLGIESRNETLHGVVENAFIPIIERNTTLPASRMQYFSTVHSNQKQIEVKVYQGESPIAAENIKLGAMMVNVPPKPAGQEGIEVRFSYDVSSLLQVEVMVVSTERKTEIVIQGNAEPMPKAELAARLKALEAYKIHPRENLENQEVLAKLKQLYAMHLGADRDMITNLLAHFETVLNSFDKREIAKERAAIQEEITIIENKYVR